jgi:hypothetical protein
MTTLRVPSRAKDIGKKQVRRAKSPGPRPTPKAKRRLIRETMLVDENCRRVLDYLHSRVDAELRQQVEEGKCLYSGQYVKDSSNPDDVNLSRSTLLAWMLMSILKKVAIEARLPFNDDAQTWPPEGFQSKYF